MGLKLNATTGGGSVELDVPNSVTGDHTLTLPSGVGSANQFIKNSGTAGTIEYSTTTEDSDGILHSPNQPYFMASLSSSTAISNSTDTVIAWQQIATDTASAYNSGNNSYDCPVDGLYLVNLTVQFTTDVGALHNGMKINGLGPGTNFDPWCNSGANERGHSRSEVFSLSAGDSISCHAYQTSGGSASLEANRTKVTIAYLG